MKKILYIFKDTKIWDPRLFKFAKSFKEEGYQTRVLLRWSKTAKDNIGNSDFDFTYCGANLPARLTIPLSSNPIWRYAIEKEILEFKPDIIIPREIMLASAAADIGHKYNIPVVMDMAEHYPAAMREWEKYNNSFIKRIALHKLRLPDRVEANAVKKIDGIITVCYEQIQRLEQQYGFDSNYAISIHNTPEKWQFEGCRLGLNNPPKVFGHHGYMTPEKSMVPFLKGFIEAAKIDNEIKLVLAGTGDSIPELKEIAESSEVSSRIIFTGSYKHPNLKDILSTIDVGVVPYTINDFNNHTIHNKIFDYFALGKPVLVSETKPNIRLINETNAGFIVDCSNPESIAKAILDICKMDLSEVSKNGLSASRNKYNWDIDSRNLIAFINKFIN